MSATQLAFTLRTSPNCKTVHLVGNWDGYKGQLPLSKDSSSSKPGAWKGTFRFQSSTLKQGQRYWYYYIMDGYHVSHDPAKPFTTEPTTGRQLNILDVPTVKSSSATQPQSTSSRGSRHSSSKSAVPQGRPISPSRIVSPRPVNPIAARHIQSADYAKQVASLSRKLASTRIETRAPPSVSSSSGSEFEEDDSSDSASDSDDDDSDISDDSVPSLGSSRTSDCSSPRSVSSKTSSSSSRSSSSSGRSTCSCERYGITRKGDRVRLDCGGSRCGSSDGDSCSSEESEGEQYKTRFQESRRQGVVVKGGSRR